MENIHPAVLLVVGILIFLVSLGFLVFILRNPGSKIRGANNPVDDFIGKRISVDGFINVFSHKKG